MAFVFVARLDRGDRTYTMGGMDTTRMPLEAKLDTTLPGLVTKIDLIQLEDRLWKLGVVIALATTSAIIAFMMYCQSLPPPPAAHPQPIVIQVPAAPPPAAPPAK